MERHMTKPCIVLSGLLLLASSVRAGGGDPKELARRIDQRLMDRLNQAGVTPAPTIDDAAFLRRASLDLIGRIPTSHEVHAFLRDTTPALFLLGKVEECIQLLVDRYCKQHSMS
jgi:hypothetical protein